MTPRMLTLAGLVLLAALARLLPHSPNFAPITAMAVFGAIRYGSKRAAVAVPLLALFLSDLAKEALYRNGLARDQGLYADMGVVYGATALVVLIGRLAHGTRSPAVMAASVLAGSCTFFVFTNFAVWAGGSLYPRTAEGLAACYVAALPFFGNALRGDLTYGILLFGVWALLEAQFPVLRPSRLPQPS